MELSYGSLCTGYDGIGLALQLAGLPIVPRWMAENDEDMSLVLKHEHPDVPNASDIKKAPWHLAPHVEIMSSGDPCQSISIAGRQLGREDPRFLWPWVRAAYQAVRPTAIFFENVSNIVSHDGGRTLAERHAHLREDGYEVRWTVLGACAVGAPHHRHRYYAVAALWTGPGPVPEARRVGGDNAICGAPRSGGRILLPLPDASMSTRGGMLSPEKALERMANPDRTTTLDDAVATPLPSPTARGGPSGPGRTERREGSDDLRTVAATYLPLRPTPRASDGENGRGNPGQVYGSGTLPLSGAVALLPTPMADRSGSNVGGAAGRQGQPVRPSLDSVRDLLPTPTTSNAHGNETNNRGELLLPGVAVRPEVWGKFAEAVALWEMITGVPAPTPTEPGPRGGPRLAPALPEWMMGLRPGLLTDRLGRAAALKGAGNGVVPLAAAAAWNLLTA